LPDGCANGRIKGIAPDQTGMGLPILGNEVINSHTASGDDFSHWIGFLVLSKIVCYLSGNLVGGNL
jgi:hypothetical protein